MDTKHADDILEMMGSLGGKLNVITGINRSGKSNRLNFISQDQKSQNNIFYHHYKVDAMINHKWNQFYSNNKDKIIPNTNKTIKDLCNAINLIKPNISKIFLLSNLGDNRYKYYSDYKIMHSVYESLQINPDWKSIEWDLYRKILNQYDTNIISLLFNIVEPSLFFLPQQQKEPDIDLTQKDDGSVDAPYEVVEYWKKTFKIRFNDFLYNDIRNPNISLAVKDDGNFDIPNEWSDDLIALCDKINKYDSLEKYNRIIPADYEKSLKNSIQPFNLLNSPSDGQKSIMALIMISFFIEKGYNFLSNAGTLVNNKPDYILLDEPDAFLNPQLIQTMLEIIRTEFVDIKVIMTTHNPSTVAYCKEEEVFWMENGKILKDDNKVDKMDIVRRLSTGFLPSIDSKNCFNILIDPTKDCYLFFEGWCDIQHFKMACDRILDADGNKKYKHIYDKCQFLSLEGCFDEDKKTSKGVNIFLNWFDSAIKQQNMDKKIIALFDSDTVGTQTREALFKKQIHNDIYTISEKKKNIYGITLKQTNVSTEQLYEGSVWGQYFHYSSKKNRFCEKKKKKKTKPGFVEYVKTNADNINFDGFKPTLEVINEINN